MSHCWPEAACATPLHPSLNHALWMDVCRQEPSRVALGLSGLDGQNKLAQPRIRLNPPLIRALPFLAYTHAHAGGWPATHHCSHCSPCRWLFGPSYSYPVLTASPCLSGPAGAWRKPDCFAAEACCFACSPVSPCPAPFITVCPPPRGRAAPLRPCIVGEVGASPPNQQTGRVPGGDCLLDAQTVPVIHNNP